MVNLIKRTSARYGHIKRRLLRGEPLSRDLLELALDLVGDGNTGDELLDGIANKLIANQPLGDYERHLMVDVFLLHARLACASALRQSDPAVDR